MAKTAQIQIRVEPEEKQELIKKAKSFGFSSLSEFMYFVARNADIKVKVNILKQEKEKL